MTATQKTTAKDVRRAVYHHFMPRWAVVFEVTAADDSTWRGGRQRRIDALLVRRSPRLPTPQQQQLAAYRAAYEARRADTAAPAEVQPAGPFDIPAPASPQPPSPPQPADDGGLERLALEIKVSRADFLQDVRQPEKQASWRELAHRHAYVVPKGLVRVDEVPAASGLLEVGAACTWARRAPRTDAARPLPTAIVLDAFYRWARAEALAKGIDSGGRTDEDAVRAELARLRRENEALDGQVERLRETTEAWKRRYAALDPPPCSTCGKPLRPARRQSALGYLTWEHAAADALPCEVLRTARAMEAKGEAFNRWDVLSPEPAYPDDECAAVPA
jgi:hypothetical protein